MRKWYRKKRRCCRLCKGNKRGVSIRWTEEDLQLLVEFEDIERMVRRDHRAWVREAK